jgi:hypothetical protein
VCQQSKASPYGRGGWGDELLIGWLVGLKNTTQDFAHEAFSLSSQVQTNRSDERA